MTVQVIALVTINEDQPRALAAYLDATLPLLEAAGGKINQHFIMKDAVVGRRPAQSVIIVDYPDMAAVDMVFGSKAYQAIIPIRDLAFEVYSVTVISPEGAEQVE